MRALILATFIAYLLTDWRKPPDVEISLEGRGVMPKVPTVVFVLAPLIDEKKMPLLRVTSPNRIYRPRELCKLFGRDRSTLYRYLKALCNAGLIKRVDREFELTELGEILRG